MGLSLPLFHTDFLEVVTKWDPNGLPAAYPFGHRYYTENGAVVKITSHQV